MGLSQPPVSLQPGVPQWLTIPITSAPDGSVQDSGYDLPVGAYVLEAVQQTTTGDSGGGGLAVGNPNDIFGYLADSPVDAVGFFAPNSLASKGTLLGGGDKQLGFLTLFRVASGKQRVYYQSSVGFTTWRGKIHILYINPPA